MGDSYVPSSQHGQAMLASVPILCIHNDSQWLDRNALCLRCSGPCFWIKYWQVLRFRQLFSALICFHECNKTLNKKKDMPWCISFNIILACDSCISSVHLFKTCLSRPILCGRCQRWRVICCDCRFSTWRKELESSKSSFGPKVTKKNCKIIASKRVRTHSNFKTPFLSLRFPICCFMFFQEIVDSLPSPCRSRGAIVMLPATNGFDWTRSTMDTCASDWQRSANAYEILWIYKLIHMNSWPSWLPPSKLPLPETRVW